ncbi:MAG: glycosyltransferase [Candidatus Tectomicrobia bacterium]|nr:glycosyltransferase [Candidatus Tectomicrobia bacterium]
MAPYIDKTGTAASQNGHARNGHHPAAAAPSRNGHDPAGVATLEALAIQEAGPSPRPEVRGKFLYAGGRKLWVKGVTYGTFRPDAYGNEFHRPELVERDFAMMAACGVNAVRTYTVPPRWLLDLAARRGLYVMAGLPWEQHLAFLDGRKTAWSIVERLRAAVRGIAGHPALLCYAVGNEIPAPIVRWHGRRRAERFIKRLYSAAKAEDPAGLVTYVNYPTTEYLELPFLDFACFNVYLEERGRYEAYLARLHNLAGEHPLVMAEIGLDSRRNGEEAQARSLEWQVRAAFEGGCAGAFAFAWTDEWFRGGFDIEDWDFGLTTRGREPKRALAAVRRAFGDAPFAAALPWPRASVVVCSCNGSRTIRDTLEGLQALDYPGECEVIVVDDGSRDATPRIASEFPVRLIRTENRGLSSARNTGWQNATGEIVAYIDDDARPDPHWLTYLASVFMRTDHAAAGGPNLPPAGDGLAADCVANAPGGPNHVLLTDTVAEHIPGCNMAFRRAALEAVGGFDPQFRVAGDDVDLCWRIQQMGWTIAFHPAAMVWHHRRSSVPAYWRQQKGYGKAEAMLERKWPEKYNAAGHLMWAGRIYGPGLAQPLSTLRSRVFHGVWGSAPFQSLYRPAPAPLACLTLMPEWYLVIALLGFFTLLGVAWGPLHWAGLPFALAASATLAQAALSAVRSHFPSPDHTPAEHWKRLALTGYLHLLQPLARLWGRLAFGLTPWRGTRLSDLALPGPRRISLWRERWRPLEEVMGALVKALRRARAQVLPGGEFDRWDLEVRGGLMGGVRLRAVVEEHGAGKHLFRFRIWPRPSAGGAIAAGLFAALAPEAAREGALLAAAVLGGGALLLGAAILRDCAAAAGKLVRVLRERGEGVLLPRRAEKVRAE